MGMTKVNSKSSSMTDAYPISKLSWLKPSDRAKILKAGDILIKLSSDPKKSGVGSIKFEPFCNLLHDFAQAPTELNPANIIWAAGWIIKKSDDKFSHVNWNTIGWRMFAIATRNPQAQFCTNQSSIAIPTIIAQSTLLFCDAFNLKITFDLLIWSNAVDLILSERIPIISILGGFHLLKSYVATFRVIFADSGLHDIIKLIYVGELTADSILNGNSYDKTIRTHFLIDATILQHVIPGSTFTNNEVSLIKTIISKM